MPNRQNGIAKQPNKTTLERNFTSVFTSRKDVAWIKI